MPLLRSSEELKTYQLILDFHIHTVGRWYRYEDCPPSKERLPHWPQSKLDDLEVKFFAITGKLLDELFPDSIQDKKFLKSKKTLEATKEIDSSQLMLMSENIRSIQYVDTDAAEVAELSDDVRKLLKSLPFREREIIKMRYGFNGDPMTFEQVGKFFKITQERVRQIELRVIRKLQQPENSKLLIGHLSE
jgi:RNA polymerase sigma factor (sigma-70 family)